MPEIFTAVDWVTSLTGTFFDPVKIWLSAKARDQRKAAAFAGGLAGQRDTILSASHPAWQTAPVITAGNFQAVGIPQFTADPLGGSPVLTSYSPMPFTQTFDEAQANLHRQQVTYLAHLQQRLDDGTITQKHFDDEQWLVYQNLDSPDAAYWDGFLQAVKTEAANLPGSISSGAQAVGGWVGNTAGGLVGSTAKGYFSSLFSSGGIPVVLGVIVGGVVLFWLFTKGPLSKMKISALPIPV